MQKLKLGLPKGSLQESTIRVFERAGFNVYVSSRSYFPSIDDETISPVLLRAQEMSRYVEDGTLDCGITGADWVLENGSKVTSLADLVYAKQSAVKVRWVFGCSGKIFYQVRQRPERQTDRHGSGERDQEILEKEQRERGD